MKFNPIPDHPNPHPSISIHYPLTIIPYPISKLTRKEENLRTSSSQINDLVNVTAKDWSKTGFYVINLFFFSYAKMNIFASLLNKAGYTATPVACGWTGAVFEVT